MLVFMLTLFLNVLPAKASISSPGNQALNWAEHYAAGCWYDYGGTSCAQGYDCSGLVSQAFLHGAGIWIGRDTFTQLATNGEGHFHQIPLDEARRGDILFYGTGHEEIDTSWYHMTFGAQEPGTRVGWHEWSGWWQPTEAFEVW